MHIKVLFFATLRDKAGVKMLELQIAPGTTVQQLKDAVAGRIPGLQESLAYCLAAVNHEYSDEQAEIPADAEVAFFPPVSGGGGGIRNNA